MKEEDKEYIRAFAAMFAMNGLIVRGDAAYAPKVFVTGGLDWGNLMRDSFRMADSFMDELQSQDTTGIAAIKPKKKHERKA